MHPGDRFPEGLGRHRVGVTPGFGFGADQHRHLFVRHREVHEHPPGHLRIQVDPPRFGGRPVGLFDDAEYENHEIPLPRRFSLTLCSDGVLDCVAGTTLKEKEDNLPLLVEQAGGDLSRLMALLGMAEAKVMPDDISVLLLSRNPE